MRGLIRVEVRLYASLEKTRPPLKAGEPFSLEFGAKMTVSQLAGSLGIATQSIQLAFVNGIIRGLDHRLLNGDRVAFFPPIGGG